jgi:CHAT domain-containing protein
MADRNKAASIRHSAAIAALAGDAPSAALALAGEILADPDLADPISLAETRLLQARILQELGDTAAASAAMAAARPLVAEIRDPAMAFRLDAKLAIAEAVLPLGMQAGDTVPRLSRAIAKVQASGTSVALPELLLARARGRMALDQVQGAQDDAIAAFELLRDQAPGGAAAFWLAHFEPEEMVRDLVAASLVEHGDAEAAFRIAEAARSFHPEVPSLFASELPRETTPKVVRSLLAPGEAFVFLASHGDAVTAWVLTPSRERTLTLRLPRLETGQRIARLVEDLSHKRWGSSSRRLSEGLYEDLVRPIAEAAPDATRWIVSSSGPLSRVPFPVLLDRSTGRFVVEDLEVVSVPSAGFLVQARAGHPPAAEPRIGEPRSILAIGNPAHDERLFPRLGQLPGAETEARQVAAFYPDADLLIGPRATETLFKRRAAHFDMIHVAAHAMGNRPGLLRSSVLLATDPVAGDGGTLFAEEIARLALPRARAVVLSACGSARGEAGRGDQGSLARAFLAAGAQATIASLWDIDDASTVALSVALHRRLASGTAPSRALRGAQLALLASDHRGSPWVWGAFQVSGV